MSDTRLKEFRPQCLRRLPLKFERALHAMWTSTTRSSLFSFWAMVTVALLLAVPGISMARFGASWFRVRPCRTKAKPHSATSYQQQNQGSFQASFACAESRAKMVPSTHPNLPRSFFNASRCGPRGAEFRERPLVASSDQLRETRAHPLQHPPCPTTSLRRSVTSMSAGVRRNST